MDVRDNQPNLKPTAEGPNGSSAESDVRLNGWKEIANYLGKSERTAQRWERLFGLPIHRIGGEVVFAIRGEVHAWSTSQDGLHAGPTSGVGGVTGLSGNDGIAIDTPPGGFPEDPFATATGVPVATVTSVTGVDNVNSDRWPETRWVPSRTIGCLLALVGILITIGLGFSWTNPNRSTPPQIHAWRFVADELRVFDESGRELWKYPFATAQNPASSDASDAQFQRKEAIITDVDGDGIRELLLVSREKEVSLRSLYVFNADGKLRFSHQRTGHVEFGQREYQGPFYGRWIEVTREPDGTSAVWFQSAHVPEFPSVIERIDSRGKKLAEYWSGGYLESMAIGDLGGRRLLFIGGAANEGYGASLAVFNTAQFGGAAPGPDIKHTCTSCEQGRPLYAFIFPREELGRLHGSESHVRDIRLRGGEVLVDVNYYKQVLPGDSRELLADSRYVLDAKLNVIHAEYTNAYRVIHDYLWGVRRLDHPFSAKEEATLFPVSRWSKDSPAFAPVRLK